MEVNKFVSTQLPYGDFDSNQREEDAESNRLNDTFYDSDGSIVPKKQVVSGFNSFHYTGIKREIVMGIYDRY